ncbi:MAG: hypothetical protein IJP21_01085 [Clostridia bacterium]|nr:hypothetical protein [Clostridia bacterium]
MSGYKILEQALALMGIYSIPQEVKRTGLLIINSVCEDLKLSGLSAIEEKLDCQNQKTLIAITYGVAMQLALIMSDDYLKNVFEALYSKKRSEIKNNITSVKDQVFKGEI